MASGQLGLVPDSAELDRAELHADEPCHGAKRVLYGALSHGGTAYFAAKSDLSTFLEDLALVRPTHLSFVPRVWDMLSAAVHSEVERRSSHGADAALDAEVINRRARPACSATDT